MGAAAGAALDLLVGIGFVAGTGAEGLGIAEDSLISGIFAVLDDGAAESAREDDNEADRGVETALEFEGLTVDVRTVRGFLAIQEL